MKNSNTISDIAAILLLLSLTGCKPSGAVITEKPSSKSSGASDSRGFDPLELPQDKTIIPREHPQTGPLGTANDQSPDSSMGYLTLDTTRLIQMVTYDTLSNQIYRVQLATTRLFGEARKIVSVAEEIFDLPVIVDYEVPNFKVRVGGFADRTQAEVYQEKCRSAGYKTAWIVMVNLNVRSLEPLYLDLPAMVPHDTLNNDTTDNERHP